MNGINQLINSINQWIKGIIRVINDWGPGRGPGATARPPSPTGPPCGGTGAPAIH